MPETDDTTADVAREDEVTTRRWKHRRGDRYELISASVVGNPERGYTIEHYLHSCPSLDSIAEAKSHGFACLDRSDDFNIGAIRDGRLVAILWMDEIVDDEFEVLDPIAVETGLGRPLGSDPSEGA